MSYEVLNISKERELCSVVGKRAWDKVEREIDLLAKEMKLSKQEKDALIQRQMASLRYMELQAENKYLSRTQETFALRKIEKNKLEMQRMNRIYIKNQNEVQKSEPVLKQRVQEKQLLSDNQQKNTNKK